MENITDENLISLLKEKFPDFIPYWESYVEYWGINQGLTIQITPFSDYVVDVIKSKNEDEIKHVFDFIEFSICNGDESVQTTMTTSFLEDLLSRAPTEINFSTFAKYLGEESKEYCKAWDKFCGMRTEGLWDDERTTNWKWLQSFKLLITRFAKKTRIF